jgi:hypothetical protein
VFLSRFAWSPYTLERMIANYRRSDALYKDGLYFISDAQPSISLASILWRTLVRP